MAVTLTIAGTDRSRLVVAGSVRMLNQLTRQVDQASFDIDKYGSRTFAPSVGQEVVIQNGSTKLFAGRIVQVDEQYDKLDLVRYRIQCVDYTRDLDHQLVVETYEDQTINAIIADIKSRYLPSTITTTNVDAPVTVKYIAFNYEYPSDCLKQLAELVNYDWYVDYDKDIHFFAKEENAAPFELSDTGGKYIYESLSLKKDITPVRNTVYVRGVEYKGDTFTVERTGDGVHQLWGTEYKFADIRVVTTGQEKSVGLDNIDNATNYDCLYNFTEKFIRFRADKIPTSGTLIQIIGRPWLPVLVKVRDSASIDTFSALEGNGLYEYKIIDRSIRTKEGARQRALAELLAYSATSVEGEFETYADGLRAGMRIRVDSDLRGIDAYYVINKVESFIEVANKDTVKIRYRISLLTTRTFDHIDLLQKLLKDANKEVRVDEDNELIDEIENDDETLTMVEAVTFTAEERAYVWGATGAPILYWNLGDWG